MGLNHAQQFFYHLRHAGKVAGAVLPFQGFGYKAKVYGVVLFKTIGIHFLNRGQVEYIAAGIYQHFYIPVKGNGVFLKIAVS